MKQNEKAHQLRPDKHQPTSTALTTLKFALQTNSHFLAIWSTLNRLLRRYAQFRSNFVPQQSNQLSCLVKRKHTYVVHFFKLHTVQLPFFSLDLVLAYFQSPTKKSTHPLYLPCSFSPLFWFGLNLPNCTDLKFLNSLNTLPNPC